MALVVELLGRPRISRDGTAVPPPPGRKTWGLLAYLLLAPRPPSRSRLAELLFGEADDPLGALRWSMSQLRRLLGAECIIGGDPVAVSFPVTTVVDVELLRRGRWEDAVDLRGLGCPLLECVDVSGSAAFDIWLANERRRLAGAAEAVLHEAALACLAAGAVDRAVGHASRLVELGPLNEANHVLMVQCLRSAGDHRGAAEQVARCRDLFRTELGVEPSQALGEAARVPVPAPLGGAPYSVQAMVEAGQAAVAAGALSQGFQTLWQAVGLARQGHDELLLARVLMALGHALVHAGKGGDEEGGAVLREAADRALKAGDLPLAAGAYSDLAYADLERGRYERAHDWIASASELAAANDGELAWIESIAGAALSDQGCYGRALMTLGSAVERAERAQAREADVFARSFLGRLHLLRGELDEAASALDRAAQDARACWMALLPWPESLLAEVELLSGDHAGAEARFERAFVMGRQLDDPCLQSISTRGLGLVAVARGQVARGYRLLVDAPRISRRLPDSYLWIEGYGLDALCTVAIEHHAAAAPRWVADLEGLASRCGMRELVARAMLHRARLGERAAFEAGRELVASIDNPSLHAELLATTA